MATHALGHMIYGYTLLVPMNERVLNKPSKEHNIRGISIIMLSSLCFIGTNNITVHNVPNCMSCYKAIVVITGGGLAYCYDCIYIYMGVCVCVYIYIYIYIVDLIAQSVRASERNSVVVGSNPTQANFL